MMLIITSIRSNKNLVRHPLYSLTAAASLLCPWLHFFFLLHLFVCVLDFENPHFFSGWLLAIFIFIDPLPVSLEARRVMEPHRAALGTAENTCREIHMLLCNLAHRPHVSFSRLEINFRFLAGFCGAITKRVGCEIVPDRSVPHCIVFIWNSSFRVSFVFCAWASGWLFTSMSSTFPEIPHTSAFHLKLNL